MLKKILPFLGITFFIFFISNCEYFTLMSQKEWMEKADMEDDDVIIYASGGTDGTSDCRPCYWKITKNNYKTIYLESNNEWGVAYSIYVKGDNIYTCGFDQPSGGGLVRACYWINKKKYTLQVKDPSIYSSIAYQIIFKSRIIFTTGHQENSGDYDAISWIDQNMYILHSFPPNSQAECIFMQQESSSKHYTYIGGMYSGKPCYWKDYQINYLEDGGSSNLKVRSIYVIGNNVHACGIENDTTAPDHACYWKDEKLTYLPGGTDAKSLFVSNEDVYIAGINDDLGIIYACYWKNGKKKSLPDSFFSGGDSCATSIFVFNNNVYIGGYDADSTVTNIRAWYCINGEKKFLDSSLNAGVQSIFVKAKNDN